MDVLSSRLASRVSVGTIAVVLAATVLTACSTSSEQSSPGLPGGAVPSDQITLAAIEPDDGTAPVTEFIGSAKKSLDIVMYEFDPTVTAITSAIKAAQARGVIVRVLLSRQIFPDGLNNHNKRDRKTLLGMGIDTQLSRPHFSYSHQKSYLIDAGTPQARALITDFNIGPAYTAFVEAPVYGTPTELGTRGLAVLNTDPKDLAEIAAVFEADWPPYKKWPAYDRPNLIWAPGDPEYVPTGNSITALTALIRDARVSIDLYVQAMQYPSILFQPLLEQAQAGIQVRIVGNLGGIDDNAAAQLTAAGAKIVYGPRLKQDPKAHLYVHSKTIVADHNTDRAVAFVGSENPFLDQSLQSERELGAFVTDRKSLEGILEVFNSDFSRSTPYPIKSPSPSS